MKLSEIVLSKNPADPQGAGDEVCSHLAHNNKELLKLNSKQFIGKAGNKFTFNYDGDIIGFVSLSAPISIHGHTYAVVNMLYAKEKYRKTFAMGLFIIGLRKVLDYPIIVGHDSKGGALSLDGEELVRSLKSHRESLVKVLNLKTGKMRKITNADLQSDNDEITFVFEGSDWPLEWGADDKDFKDLNTHFYIWENSLDIEK